MAKLVTKEQMKKSVRVFVNISQNLRACKVSEWVNRKNYTIIPSFLWYCNKDADILQESDIVQEMFDKYKEKSMEADLLNIVITSPSENKLINNFVYKKKRFMDICIPFMK
jgi:hypothetical protein